MNNKLKIISITGNVLYYALFAFYSIKDYFYHLTDFKWIVWVFIFHVAFTPVLLTWNISVIKPFTLKVILSLIPFTMLVLWIAIYILFMGL